MTDLAPLLRRDTGLAAAVRWHVNDWFTRRPWLLHWLGARLTVFDAFGAPGDTLLTAIVCRHLHERHPRIRINCLTPNPELLLHDPNIETLNARESWFCLWHWYLGLVEKKDGCVNVLRPTFDHLGFGPCAYRAKVFLSDLEIAGARARLGATAKPVLAFNTRSKEAVKNWPVESWNDLLERLRAEFDLMHLGDATEPHFAGVRRFAGLLSLRESMALLACARLHVGPDSFLMHAANGLDVPSVIIFGGSRTPANLGYDGNVNLFVEMPCGPCWIHASRGERCEHDLACLKKISVEEVHAETMKLWRKIAAETSP